MLVDERPHFFLRRSSSVCAKNALASRRISLVWRNSLTSRSSALMRSRSAVGMPSRTPVSISCFLTQSCNMTVEQPIIGAIDSTATHSDGRSLSASCTSRTARSLTSGEYLFVLLMVPFSQEMEPLQFPGRFTFNPAVNTVTPTRQRSTHLRPIFSP